MPSNNNRTKLETIQRNPDVQGNDASGVHDDAEYGSGSIAVVQSLRMVKSGRVGGNAGLGGTRECLAKVRKPR